MESKELSLFDINIREKSSEDDQKRCYIPRRYILAVLSFWGMFNVFAMNVNLSVAMVAMVKSTTSLSSNGSHSIVECPNLITSTQGDETATYIGDQYNWDAKTQGYILGASYYGYIISQLPGGIMSERFGAKWVYGAGVLITSLLTLVTPIAASWGVAPFIAVRVIEGLGQGVTFPAANLVISRWAPKLQRSLMSTMIFTGNQIGNVVSMPVSGWLSSTDLLGGWPSAFYVFGTVGCIWFLLWGVFVYETPAEHPSISKKELNNILADKDDAPQKKAKFPWKAVTTSLPMWAVVFAHFGHNFGFLILLTEMPTYLSNILHFNVEDNGLVSALPYVLQAATAWGASYVADRLRKSGRLTITQIRKIWNSIGLFGPGVCLLGVTMAGCRPQLTVALFSLAMATNGFIYSGFNVTHVDMSPTFAGTLYGITNGISNTCGIFGPLLVGAFTNNGETFANWNDVFYIAVAVYFITGAFYAVFASAELQPWADGEETSVEDISVKDIAVIDSLS